MITSLDTSPPVFRSACFFSTTNGQTVQRRASAQEERDIPLPATVTNLYRFDESGVNNAGLLQQWAGNAAAFTMAGNQVLVNGQPAQFDPPGLVFEAIESAAAQWAKAQTSDAFSQQEDARLRALVFQLARLAGVL